MSDEDDIHTQNMKDLISALKMNDKAGDVLASGTMNFGAARTYREVADTLLARAKARRDREAKAKQGLQEAFPED